MARQTRQHFFENLIAVGRGVSLVETHQYIVDRHLSVADQLFDLLAESQTQLFADQRLAQVVFLAEPLLQHINGLLVLKLQLCFTKSWPVLFAIFLFVVKRALGSSVVIASSEIFWTLPVAVSFFPEAVGLPVATFVVLPLRVVVVESKFVDGLESRFAGRRGDFTSGGLPAELFGAAKLVVSRLPHVRGQPRAAAIVESRVVLFGLSFPHRNPLLLA